IKKTSTGLSREELQSQEVANQAPNRNVTWSPTQESRLEIISKYPHRFVQRDLEAQPRPYAAIDLIAKEPVRYLTHDEGNVAVCDGNRGSTLQGHPKVFINLDQPKAHTCGYCGLRYAKDEFKAQIEAEA
ncbi:NADH-ubiquinone oxidoreductase, partial [Scheffersomyces stipitis CBS 6054]